MAATKKLSPVFFLCETPVKEETKIMLNAVTLSCVAARLGKLR